MLSYHSNTVPTTTTSMRATATAPGACRGVIPQAKRAKTVWDPLTTPTLAKPIRGVKWNVHVDIKHYVCSAVLYNWHVKEVVYVDNKKFFKGLATTLLGMNYHPPYSISLRSLQDFRVPTSCPLKPHLCVCFVVISCMFVPRCERNARGANVDDGKICTSRKGFAVDKALCWKQRLNLTKPFISAWFDVLRLFFAP